MATPTSLFLPQQQQQQEVGEIGGNSEAIPGSSSTSSGSMGSFFAVMSILVVLAIVSCFVGRMCREGKVEHSICPFDSIRCKGCFGRVRRKWRRCLDGHDIEVGARVVDFGRDGKDVHAKDSEVEVPRV